MKKFITAAVFALIFAGLANAQSSSQPNVLFIAVDDLRPKLGCYGQSHIHSPNIDKLAEGGLTFNLAYCNIPVCSNLEMQTNLFFWQWVF